MEEPPPLAYETPNPQKKTSKTFKIYSETKKEYLVLFESIDNLLNISTEVKEEKSHQNKIYRNKYTLFDIQKVKYFNPYDTIDECLSEIDINKGIIKEEKDKLNLIVPINSKKYPEITFTLIFKEKSDKEKINELYEIIHNLNSKINFLEKKLEDMSNNTIKIITQEKEPNGISFYFNAIKKSELGKIFDEKKLSEDKIFFRLNFNFKNDNDKGDEFINYLKTIFPEVILKKDGKKVAANFSYPLLIEKKETKNNLEMFKYLLGTNEMENFKLTFQTDLKIKDILEIENFEVFFDKLTNCQFLLNGLSNNGKTFLIHSLINLNFLFSINEKNKNINKPICEMLTLLILMLSWSDFSLPNAKAFFNSILKIIKDNYKDEVLKLYNMFRQTIISFFNISNPFWKDFDINKMTYFENIDFEELCLAFSLCYLNIGFDMKIRLSGINELIEDKIINKIKGK